MTMTTKEACRAAPKHALIDTNPQVTVDEGYVREVRENLIEGVTFEDLKPIFCREAATS